MALRPGFVVFLPLTHSLHFRKSAHNESSFPTSRTFFLAIRRVHSFTTENFSSPANFLQAFPPFTTTTVPLSRNRFVHWLVVVSPTKRSDSWIVGYVGPLRLRNSTKFPTIANWISENDRDYGWWLLWSARRHWWRHHRFVFLAPLPIWLSSQTQKPIFYSRL